MGMYTELIFQGEIKKEVPESINSLLNYFFDKDSCLYSYFFDKELPDHPFFKCDGWKMIGHCCSHYFTPFSLRHKESNYVFMRCDIKNYNNEIELFLDWISEYMNYYYGWYWYEEDDEPTIFDRNR